MKIRHSGWIACVLLTSLAVAQTSKPHTPRVQPIPASTESRITLANGWSLQSSCKADQNGEVISKPGFQPRNWCQATVPTTVVSPLVEHKVLPDPMFGMNLRQFAGVTYPIGSNF